MKKVNRKIQISLFLFLGLCSLIVNVTAFLILVDYHSNHYRELAEAHVEQQYQNCRQRLAVFGEQIRMFAEDAVLIGEVNEHKWNEVRDRIMAFIQSSNTIESLSVYYEDEQGVLQRYGDNYGNDHGVEMEPEVVKQYWEFAGSMGKKELWFLREGAADGYEYLSYLVPMQNEGKRVGFLQADISVTIYMRELLGEESSLWDESFALLSKEAEWYSDDRFSLHFSDRMTEKQDVLFKGDELIYRKELTETGDELVQVVSLKTSDLLLPTGVTMVIIFLVSLVGIYFGVRLVSRTITVPLNEVQEKIKNTLSEE